MVEFCFDNPINKHLRPCRKIIQDCNAEFDSGVLTARQKDEFRLHGSIVLCSLSEAVPKGFAVLESVEPGQVLGRRRVNGINERAIHVCNGDFHDRKGRFKVRWQPEPAS